MSRSNALIIMYLCVVVCRIFSGATAVERPEWLAGYDDDEAEPDSESIRDMGERLGAIIGSESSWWPNTKKSDGLGNGPAKTVVAMAATTTTTEPKSSNRFELAHEFFRTLRGEKKTSTTSEYGSDDDRVAGIVDGDRISAAEPTVTAEPTATAEPTTVETTTPTTVTPDRTTFGTENQCATANGGRPCVCNTTDFLKTIGRWLDDVPATAASDDDTAAVAALKCHSYNVVPEAFVVSSPPVVDDDVTTDDHPPQERTVYDASDVSDLREVDFDQVINYRLEKSENDHYAVHYNLVGTDVKVRCLVREDGDSTDIISFKWHYKKTKHKTNSTITGTEAPNLLILGLAPEDSKNYTCIPAINKFENISSHKHYIIAVDKPNYEVRGTALYKTTYGNSCTSNFTTSVRKQLPIFLQSKICPKESSHYACNVDMETPTCIEEQKKLKIEYSVTLNDQADYLYRLRTSKKGRNALYFQKVLARISDVLAKNLRNAMKVQIINQLTYIYTHFEPDYVRTNVKTFTSCEPGFGIREIFCSACPLHHFSPNKSAECFKCPSGFHQPVAGSKKCVKCPNIFVAGCKITEEEQLSDGYIAMNCAIFVLVCFCLLGFCFGCCHGENKPRLRKSGTPIKIPKLSLRKKFKNTNDQVIISEERPIKYTKLNVD